MYRFYYLPFSIEFKEGQTVNELFPMTTDKFGEFNELMSPEDIKGIDTEWAAMRTAWKKKSLLLSTAVSLGESLALSQHIRSHRIPINRNAMDSLKLNERLQLTELLKGKPIDVQNSMTQVQFAKSFIPENQSENFNFFIFAPSWCESSREYRVLLETYFKNFPSPDLNLHSIVVEDPKEEIFEAKLFKELFPSPKNYSHEIVPRFLAVETKDGKTTVLEEGAALSALYDRYFKVHRGYLDNKLSYFLNKAAKSTKRADAKY